MKAVLDTSALLAYLQDESGCNVVEAVLANSSISSVNWSEVIQKSVVNNVDVTGIRDQLQALGCYTHKKHVVIFKHLFYI